MDPITHCLVGGLLAKTLRTSRRRFWIMMFLGEAPDVDVLFGGLGPWAFWLQHRGITHSFLGMAVQAFFYAWLFARWDRGPSDERAWQYSLPLFFHLCCDYLTSYGVPLLSPFSFQEFSGDLMPAVTVIPLLFMLVGLLTIDRRKSEGWSAVRPLWAAWALYLIVSMSGKAYASRLVGPVEGPTTVVAGRFNPLQWTAVVQKKSRYNYQPYSIDVWNGERKTGMAVLTSDNDFAIRASLQSVEAKKFVDGLRWPVARQTATADGYRVEWGTVMFSARGLVRGGLLVTEKKDGTVIKVERVVDFWTPSQS